MSNAQQSLTTSQGLEQRCTHKNEREIGTCRIARAYVASSQPQLSCQPVLLTDARHIAGHRTMPSAYVTITSDITCHLCKSRAHELVMGSPSYPVTYLPGQLSATHKPAPSQAPRGRMGQTVMHHLYSWMHPTATPVCQVGTLARQV